MSAASRRAFKIQASKVRRKMVRMDPAITAEVKETIAARAQELLGAMRSKVPVGVAPPHLRDALEVKIAKNGLTARVGLIGKRKLTKFFYAVFLEFGTKKLGKRFAFMRPSFASQKKRIQQSVREATQRAFKRAAADV